MINKVKCKHYDEENGWCKKLSDWSDPMPTIVYCPESPCEHYEETGSITDNDIIKALGFCESPDCECTSWCPMFYNGTNSKSDCRGELHKNALNLINRQKAEIERLHIANKINQKFTETWKDIAHREVGYVKIARTEAIKEFAESVKKNRRAILEAIYDRTEYSNIVDNLVKEMTEDQE